MRRTDRRVLAATLDDGRRFRALTLVDVFTRERLMMGADSSLSGHKVAPLLDQVAADRGYPKQITVDNGTEFYSRTMDSWAYRHSVQLDFIRPWRPMENGYIESFNGRLRELTSVVALAREFDLGTRRLQRLFDDYVGVGPKWVMRRYRLLEAAEQIGDGIAGNLAALAARLGYFDQSHFVRDFKAVIGRAPTDYATQRRALRTCTPSSPTGAPSSSVLD